MQYALSKRLLPQIDCPSLPVWVGGKRFRNPIGVSAGFDPLGLTFPGLFDVGFGFCEVGPCVDGWQPRQNSFFAVHKEVINQALLIGWNSGMDKRDKHGLDKGREVNLGF